MKFQIKFGSREQQKKTDSFLYKLGVRKTLPTLIINPEAPKKLLKHWQTWLHKNKLFQSKGGKRQKSTNQIKIQKKILAIYIKKNHNHLSDKELLKPGKRKTKYHWGKIWTEFKEKANVLQLTKKSFIHTKRKAY